MCTSLRACPVVLDLPTRAYLNAEKALLLEHVQNAAVLVDDVAALAKDVQRAVEHALRGCRRLIVGRARFRQRLRQVVCVLAIGICNGNAGR